VSAVLKIVSVLLDFLTGKVFRRWLARRRLAKIDRAIADGDATAVNEILDRKSRDSFLSRD
jgi:hypothetical protein